MRPATVVILLATQIGVQQPQQITLRPANGALREEFSLISSVRELTDGRVLISDMRENRIVVANFATNSVTAIGRVGEGPAEYGRPSQLWPLRGDSTIMKDGRFNFRALIFSGDKPVLTLPPDDPGLLASTRGGLVGTDNATRLLAISSNVGPLAASRDSGSFVVVHDRSTKLTDTIARFAIRPVTTGASGGGGGGPPSGAGAPSTARYAITLPYSDQATIFSDGWVAITRVDPYRVDWCAPGAPCVAGPPLRTTSPRLTDEDKRKWLEHMDRPPTLDVSRTMGWPEFVPPIGGRSIAAPDGRLFVSRFPAWESPPLLRYDVVDRGGRVAAQLSLPYGEHIVGFGARTVYIVSMDSLGIQKLRRHPW